MKWDEWRGNEKPAMWLKRLFFVRGVRADLHKFVAADDPDCFHTHPSHCFRLILAGGYVEEVYDEATGRTHMRTWKPGMMGVVKPSFAHRIEALRTSKPSYSLWIRMPVTTKVRLLGSGWKITESMSTEK